MVGAKQSPRIEDDGSLRWYYGNTVDVDFLVNLVGIDDDGLPFVIPFDSREFGAKITVSNLKRDIILEREYSFEEIEIEDENTGKINFVVSKENSEKILKGDYSLHLDLINLTTKKTVLNGDENKIVVE